MAGRQARDVAGPKERDLHALPPRASRRRSLGRRDRRKAVGDLRRSREPAARAEGNHDHADEAMTTPKVRHHRGTLVVILLGLIFLALLSALVFTTGRRPARGTTASSESLSALPLRIRLRTQPNATAPVVATETEGTKLLLLEDRGGWVRLQDPEGIA